jgi:hypothetical protein
MNVVHADPEDVCFVYVIEGETDQLQRQNAESSLIDGLARSGIVANEIEINEGGCFVVVANRDVPRLKAMFRELKAAAAPFNAAFRLHEHCVRLLLRQAVGKIVPSLGVVLAALHRAGVGVVHATAGPSALSLVIDRRYLRSAQMVLVTLTSP